ncbi:MAG: DUF4870 domain-containing protein [Nocardioidaceae bacterium]|nr:DUF4870 domain-containing protein [Nocardioidaceae bacterium]
MAAHVGALVTAWFALGLIAPLVVLVVRGGSSDFVRRHAVESLNFQISLLIYSAVGGVVAFILTIVTLGVGLLVIVPLVIAIAVLLLIFVIQAGVKANSGDEYRYPLTIRFIR